MEQAPVRYALISDIAFESFPFQYVAPTVWDYLDRHFKPADDAGWSVAPHAPYLYSRGTRADLAQMDLLTAAGEASAVAVTPIVSVNTDYADWEEARALMQPPLSPTPVFQTVAVDDWRSRDPRVVAWQSTYLDPSLVVRAPGGWRKVLVSWEVPSEPGFSFEFACALTPWAWAGWTKGQGALVEVWVSASPETGETGEMEETAPPRRVWWQWLNPRDVPADRRWHRAAVDLASFVATRRAIVTLVVGSAPTFKAADATVAWSSLRLIVPKDALPSIADSQHVEPRNIRLGVGTARRMLGFEKDDVRVFEEATSRYPELASAHAALAEVAVSLGDYRTALLASQNAVRVDPEQHHYWMRLGQELQRAGRVAEALEAMGIAIDQAPTNPNYHAALAAALVTLPKGLKKARAASLTAIRLDPANTWAWTLLSSVERQAGAPEAAVQAADRSVMLEPNEAWPHLILAESLQAMGRTHEALQALERAASLNMDAGARTALARNLLNCGRPERARDEAFAATEQDPRSSGGWTVLAQVESTLGRWGRAVRAWHKVAYLDPGNSSARVQLARSLATLGREEEALDALLAAKELAGDDPSRLREVAILLDELDWAAEAKLIWYRVRALAPGGELKEEAERRLSTLPPSEARGRIQ